MVYAEDLIEQVDIVEYISQFVDGFKEKGGELWCLSPLKDEDTPSFSIRPEMQRFYDFSSGVGGNVIDFIKAYYNCNFRKALKILSSYVGFDESAQIKIPRKLVATRVCEQFAPKKDACDSFKKSFYPPSQMERYEWNTEKFKIWLDEGISEESLKKFNVRWDAFTQRILYPIKDIDGNIVNIGGRTLLENYKELHIRKYTYLKKWKDDDGNGYMDVIYGLYENMEAIKKAGVVYIFEGMKSVLKCDTWGIHNCGALLTSHCSPHQTELLMKLGVRVIFMLDKEVDISKDKNIQKLKHYVNVYRYVDESKEVLQYTEDKLRVRRHSNVGEASRATNYKYGSIKEACEQEGQMNGYYWRFNTILRNKDAPVDRGEESFKKLSENIEMLR